MNNVYDNGLMIIGGIENVELYLVNYCKEKLRVSEILEELKDFNEDWIVAINYSNQVYHIGYWHVKHDIKNWRR